MGFVGRFILVMAVCCFTEFAFDFRQLHWMEFSFLLCFCRSVQDIKSGAIETANIKNLDSTYDSMLLE